jgi:hypothetical protein
MIPVNCRLPIADFGNLLQAKAQRAQRDSVLFNPVRGGTPAFGIFNRQISNPEPSNEQPATSNQQPVTSNQK